MLKTNLFNISENEFKRLIIDISENNDVINNVYGHIITKNGLQFEVITETAMYNGKNTNSIFIEVYDLIHKEISSDGMEFCPNITEYYPVDVSKLDLSNYEKFKYSFLNEVEKVCERREK